MFLSFSRQQLDFFDPEKLNPSSSSSSTERSATTTDKKKISKNLLFEICDLNCSFNKLRRTSDFHQLTQLVRLDLSHNLLEPNLKNLPPHLRFLNVSNNRLVSLEGCDSLLQLDTLLASNNKLKNLKYLTTTATSSSSSYPLRVLDVSDNQITTLNHLGASCLPQLTVLRAERNNIRELKDVAVLEDFVMKRDDRRVDERDNNGEKKKKAMMMNGKNVSIMLQVVALQSNPFSQHRESVSMLNSLLQNVEDFDLRRGIFSSSTVGQMVSPSENRSQHHQREIQANNRKSSNDENDVFSVLSPDREGPYQNLVSFSEDNNSSNKNPTSSTAKNHQEDFSDDYFRVVSKPPDFVQDYFQQINPSSLCSHRKGGHHHRQGENNADDEPENSSRCWTKSSIVGQNLLVCELAENSRLAKTVLPFENGNNYSSSGKVNLSMMPSTMKNNTAYAQRSFPFYPTKNTEVTDGDGVPHREQKMEEEGENQERTSFAINAASRKYLFQEEEVKKVEEENQQQQQQQTKSAFGPPAKNSSSQQFGYTVMNRDKVPLSPRQEPSVEEIEAKMAQEKEEKKEKEKNKAQQKEKPTDNSLSSMMSRRRSSAVTASRRRASSVVTFVKDDESSEKFPFGGTNIKNKKAVAAQFKPDPKPSNWLRMGPRQQKLAPPLKEIKISYTKIQQQWQADQQKKKREFEASRTERTQKAQQEQQEQEEKERQEQIEKEAEEEKKRLEEEKKLEEERIENEKQEEACRRYFSVEGADDHVKELSAALNHQRKLDQNVSQKYDHFYVKPTATTTSSVNNGGEIGLLPSSSSSQQYHQVFVDPANLHMIKTATVKMVHYAPAGLSFSPPPPPPQHQKQKPKHHPTKFFSNSSSTVLHLPVPLPEDQEELYRQYLKNSNNNNSTSEIIRRKEVPLRNLIDSALRSETAVEEDAAREKKRREKEKAEQRIQEELETERKKREELEEELKLMKEKEQEPIDEELEKQKKGLLPSSSRRTSSVMMGGGDGNQGGGIRRSSFPSTSSRKSSIAVFDSAMITNKIPTNASAFRRSSTSGVSSSASVMAKNNQSHQQRQQLFQQSANEEAKARADKVKISSATSSTLNAPVREHQRFRRVNAFFDKSKAGKDLIKQSENEERQKREKEEREREEQKQKEEEAKRKERELENEKKRNEEQIRKSTQPPPLPAQALLNARLKLQQAAAKTPRIEVWANQQKQKSLQKAFDQHSMGNSHPSDISELQKRTVDREIFVKEAEYQDVIIKLMNEKKKRLQEQEAEKEKKQKEETDAKTKRRASSSLSRNSKNSNNNGRTPLFNKSPSFVSSRNRRSSSISGKKQTTAAAEPLTETEILLRSCEDAGGKENNTSSSSSVSFRTAAQQLATSILSPHHH